jgi:hypothetical protein
LLTYGAALLMGPPFSWVSYPSGYLLQQHNDGLLLIRKARALIDQIPATPATASGAGSETESGKD